MKPTTPNVSRRPISSTNNTSVSARASAPGSALPKHLQQPPVPQPPPWSEKRIRPIEHHASAFKKSAMETFELEMKQQQSQGDYRQSNPYYHQNMNHNRNHNSSLSDFNSPSFITTATTTTNNNTRNELKIGEKEIREQDSWQTLSTMTHHSEEAALAAIRRIFIAANLRRKKHLEAVAKRDARAQTLESAGDRVLLSLGIDPKAPTPGIQKQTAVVDPLIRCLQHTTFLGDLIGIQQEQKEQQLQQQQQQQQQNNSNSNSSSHLHHHNKNVRGGSGRTIQTDPNGGATREEFPTVIPEEFWVFEDTPLIGSIGLEEDIVAAQEREGPHVPKIQRSSHTSSLSARVFPSRGSRCAESRVEVYYLANALDTMLQRYLQRGVFPRYPSSKELQEREEVMFDVIMCGMRELVRHNAARTIERGRVLERLRMAVENLWESRKVTLDKAQSEIHQLYDVNDPSKFVDLERLVENQALEIEQLKLSVSELKEQNEVLKGMDHLLKLARDKERAVSEYLTRQAARNVTLSRLQQQIELDMSTFESILNENGLADDDDDDDDNDDHYHHHDSGNVGQPQHSKVMRKKSDASAAMANLLRGVKTLTSTISAAGEGGGGGSSDSPANNNNNNNNNNNVTKNDNKQNQSSDRSSSPLSSSNTTTTTTAAASPSSQLRSAFAPVLDISAQEARMQRKKSFSNLARKLSMSSFAVNNNNHNKNNSSNRENRRRSSANGGGSRSGSRLSKTGSMNFGIVDGVDASPPAASAFARYAANVEHEEQQLLLQQAKPAVDTFDFTVQCNMDRAHDREIMESTRSLLETTGTALHVADRLTQTFFGSDIDQGKDPIGHGGVAFLKDLTRRTLQMEAALREAATAPADASSLSGAFSKLYPTDSSQTMIFDKEMLGAVLQTCFESSREVHVRLSALSRHPGVVNAVDPLVPPTSPDQPCTLCGRTVLRRAEEGEDELQRAINEIEQLTASLERSHLEKEMFKEEIMRLETRLRRKGVATTADVGIEVDPDLDKGRELTPDEARSKAEFSARAVLKAVKAFRSLIFQEGDFVQIRKKKVARRRTLLIAGSGAVKLHKAVSMFNRAGSMTRSSKSKSPQRGTTTANSNHDLNNNNTSPSPQRGESMRIKQPTSPTSPTSPISFVKNDAFSSHVDENIAGTQLVVSEGSFGNPKQLQNHHSSQQGKQAFATTKSTSKSPSPHRQHHPTKSGKRQRHHLNKNSSTANEAHDDGDDDYPKSLKPSQSPTCTSLQHATSPTTTTTTTTTIHIKPMSWVIKSFNGAISIFAKQDSLAFQRNRAASLSFGLHPNLLQQQQHRSPTPSANSPSSATTATNATGTGQHQHQHQQRRRTLSGTLAMMTTMMSRNEASGSSPNSTANIILSNNSFSSSPVNTSCKDNNITNINNNSNNVVVVSASSGKDDYLDIDYVASNSQTIEDAMEEYFKQQLGTKQLVEENMSAFNASWPKYRKADPRIDLIEKLHCWSKEEVALKEKATKVAPRSTSSSSSTVSRSAKTLMLYVVASLSRTLDEMSEVYGERPGDDDPRRAGSIPLLQALGAFHAVCGSSSFFSVGVEHLILYSSTSLGAFNLALPPPGSQNTTSNSNNQNQNQNNNNNNNNNNQIFNSTFTTTDEAKKFLPPDAHSRRVLRSRVLLLALLLEKSVSEKRLLTPAASGIFAPSPSLSQPFADEGIGNILVRKDSLVFIGGAGAMTPANNNSSDQIHNSVRRSTGGGSSSSPTMMRQRQENKLFFKAVLGEFADCCGKAEVEDTDELRLMENKSFAENYGRFLKM